MDIDTPPFIPPLYLTLQASRSADSDGQMRQEIGGNIQVSSEGI